MNEEQERDLHYFMGYIHADLSQIKEDISELKSTYIPEGKPRITKIEEEINTLKTWRNTMMTLGTGVASVVGYLIHETVNLWGKLNG